MDTVDSPSVEKIAVASPPSPAEPLATVGPSLPFISSAGHRWSLTLLLEDGPFKITKSLFISLIHKFHRKNRNDCLLYILKNFLHSMGKLDAVDTKKMKGSVTNVFNRVSIVHLEEGSAIFLSDTTQKFVSLHLTRIRECMTAVFTVVETKKRFLLDFMGPTAEPLGTNDLYALCYKMLRKVLACTHGTWRSRLMSMLKAASGAGWETTDPVQKMVLANMKPHIVQAVFDCIQKKQKKHENWSIAFDVATRFLPNLALIIDRNGSEGGAKLSESAELQKNMYSAAWASLLLGGGKLPESLEKLKKLQPEIFNSGFIATVGAYCQHVVGASSEKGREIFQYIGSGVEHEFTGFIICGRSHEALTQHYRDFSEKTQLAKLEAKRTAKKISPVPKRPTEQPKATTSNKKIKRDTEPLDEFIVFKNFEECVEFTTANGGCILGFKHLTALVIWKARGFEALVGVGQQVFIKGGDLTANVIFTIDANRATQWLGMPTVQSFGVGVVWDPAVVEKFIDECVLADPEGVKIGGKSYRKWGTAMMKTFPVSKLITGRKISVLVQPVIDGIRLTYIKDGDPRLLFEIFGKSLMECLLFSKFVGITDLGPFNMLCKSSGEVYHVDLGLATNSQMEKYNKKGFCTSHKIPAKFMDRAYQYATENPAAIETFLMKLKSCGMEMHGAVQMPENADAVIAMLSVKA